MMAEMSPGDKWLLGGASNGRKWGYLKMAKILFFVISAVVFVVIFYTNTSIMGGRRRSSLLALFDLSASDADIVEPYQGTAAPLLGAPAEISYKSHNYSNSSNQRRRLQNDQRSSSTSAQAESSWNAAGDIDSSEYPSWGDTEPLLMGSWIMKPPIASLSLAEAHQQHHRPLPVQLVNLSHPDNITPKTDYNIFVIYTKENYQLHVKFELFVRSLLKYSNDNAMKDTKEESSLSKDGSDKKIRDTNPSNNITFSTGMLLHLHILTDENSGHSIVQMLELAVRQYHHSIIYTLYNMRLCAERVTSIVAAMTPFFSSTPKSYYSDALFYISLGLHRIADRRLDRVVLLDCDVVFRTDVRLLFKEFMHFQPEQLFGLAPELTPVYRHILYRYRAIYPRTDFGSPFYNQQLIKTPVKHHTQFEQQLSTRNQFNHRSSRSNPNSSNKKSFNGNLIHRHGYPGLNSGVILLHLKRMRHSRFYQEQLKEPAVRQLTTKYMFKGHLGDQDFFTLLGYEYPDLIYRLDCVWNRQLCTWWKDHGYGDVFDRYFTCKGHVKMYHGNCNARVPE